jgi:hypothetical protein
MLPNCIRNVSEWNLSHYIECIQDFCGSFFHCAQSPVGQGLLTADISRSHTQNIRQNYSGREIIPTQGPLPVQHTTLTTNIRGPWKDSNPQFQQACGRRPTPQTARPPELATFVVYREVLNYLPVYKTSYATSLQYQFNSIPLFFINRRPPPASNRNSIS